MIDVAAVILINDQEDILIARRKESKQLGGYWEFPGGKLEQGESAKECLVRELQEEMDIQIEVGDYVGENIHNYQRGDIRLIAYKGRIISGTIKLTDHDKYIWVKPCELMEYNLAPADIPLASKVLCK